MALNIGDTIYVVDLENRIHPERIIEYSENVPKGLIPRIRTENDFFRYGCDFGVTCFLTAEEAETAVEKGKAWNYAARSV